MEQENDNFHFVGYNVHGYGYYLHLDATTMQLLQAGPCQDQGRLPGQLRSTNTNDKSLTLHCTKYLVIYL
jgi:hypothetical protein